MGAPTTHSTSGLSLARHVHGILGHVHRSSLYGNVLSWDLDFWFFALMYAIFCCLFDCNACAI